MIPAVLGDRMWFQNLCDLLLSYLSAKQCVASPQ